jgi:hypothetical protein
MQRSHRCVSIAFHKPYTKISNSEKAVVTAPQSTD